MDQALFEQLRSPSGHALFEAIAAASEVQGTGAKKSSSSSSSPNAGSVDALALSSTLRKQGFEPDLIAAALTQVKLREKATAKFGDFAQRMFFTQNGFEQATRLAVAAHHAQRFLSAGVTKVADLTSGIGADSMAFAALGLDVLATDIDPLTAAIAAENLKPFPNAEVRAADGLATDFEAEGVQGIFADPARRDGTGRRIWTPESFLPPLDAVWNLRSRVGSVGIKLGPGIAHEDIPSGCEAQWISFDGDVVEVGLWFGNVARRNGLGALVLSTTASGLQATEFTAEGRNPDSDPISSTSELLEYLHEPDGAIIRAGLVTHLANEIDGRQLDPSIAYFTSNSSVAFAHRADAPGGAPSHETNAHSADAHHQTQQPQPTAPTNQPGLSSVYRVVDSLPYNVKTLRAYLKERKVGRVTIKKRGINVTPEQLRPQLALKGTNEATLVLTRVNDKKTVIVVEPVKQ